MEKKNPLDMTEKELRRQCEHQTGNLNPSFNLYYGEIKRRSQDRHAQQIKWLTFVVALSAAVTTVLAVVQFVK